MLSAKAPKKVIIVATAAVGLLIPLTAFVAGEPTASNGNHVTATDTANACQHVDAPMVDVPSASDTEPQMRIPQPAGWERVVDLGDVKHTRFAITYGDPAEYPRTLAAVALDRVPNVDAQTIFDDTRADLVELFEERGWTTELTTTAGTVCGLPAETVTYAAAPEPFTMLWVVIKTDGRTYLAIVTQDSRPDDPAYQRDAETILSGLQVFPPTTST